MQKFVYFCRKQAVLSPCLEEESPDNTEHCTFEREDICESMLAKKKITSRRKAGKGEKVG